MKTLLILVLILIVGCNSKPDYFIRGVVTEHNVTSDKWGERIYSTIIRIPSGKIVERTGLKFYAKNVGDSVSLVLTDFDNLNNR